MPRPPANDDDEYVKIELDISFDELLDCFRADGADVQRVLLDTDAGEAKLIAND